MVLLEANLDNLWRLRHSFKFEEMWTHHEECEEVVCNAWELDVAGYPMFYVYEKIKATKIALLKWPICYIQGSAEGD